MTLIFAGKNVPKRSSMSEIGAQKFYTPIILQFPPPAVFYDKAGKPAIVVPNYENSVNSLQRGASSISGGILFLPRTISFLFLLRTIQFEGLLVQDGTRRQ